MYYSHNTLAMSRLQGYYQVTEERKISYTDCLKMNITVSDYKDFHYQIFAFYLEL
jgi:hypothetical protein